LNALLELLSKPPGSAKGVSKAPGSEIFTDAADIALDPRIIADDNPVALHDYYATRIKQFCTASAPPGTDSGEWMLANALVLYTMMGKVLDRALTIPYIHIYLYLYLYLYIYICIYNQRKDD
tara:strand:+ start:1142 stop:1507 length:366 start_codon:yes stop_codon:yes gene_type:complete